jgi:type II secretory pathway pseudopilin PulG
MWKERIKFANRGFTLAETVIGLGLAAMMGSMIYGGLEVADKHKKTGEKQQSSVQTRSNFIDRVTKDLDFATEVNPETCAIIVNGQCVAYILEMTVSSSLNDSGEMNSKYIKYIPHPCDGDTCVRRVMANNNNYSDATSIIYQVEDWKVFSQCPVDLFPGIPTTTSDRRICLAFKEKESPEEHKIVKAFGTKTGDLAAASFFYLPDNGQYPGLTGTPPDAGDDLNDPDDYPDGSINRPPNVSDFAGATYSYNGPQGGGVTFGDPVIDYEPGGDAFIPRDGRGDGGK